MSGLTLYVSTPAQSYIPVDLPLDATVSDLIAAAGVSSNHQLLLADKFYPSNDQTTLADLSISNEQHLQLIPPQRQKLVVVNTKIVGTAPNPVTFSITGIAVVFGLPHNITLEHARGVILESETFFLGIISAGNMSKVRVILLPDSGDSDPFVSSQSTTDTLYGLPIPEYIRKSLVRQCPADEKSCYEWAKETLPRVSKQLSCPLRQTFEFIQPQGFEFHNIGKECQPSYMPPIPADYIIGDPAPKFESLPYPDFNSHNVEDEDDEDDAEYFRKYSVARPKFNWTNPPQP
jgi:hypothetical protein